MNYGCIAEHLGHSFSKAIHTQIDSYDYVLREVSKPELGDFLRARDFKGINVTIPYKRDVIPYLDGISDTAKAIGAVNTIVNRDGKLYGYNTDFGGMTALFRKMKLQLKGEKVAVLGTGGTAHTARAVAESLGAAQIVTVSRSEKPDACTYEQLYAAHGDTGILINTTPCGMYPALDDCPVAIDRFSNLHGVADAIFNPLRSRLVLAAQASGIPASGGLYMLVTQAVLTAEIFTGKHYGEDTADRVFAALLSEKSNLVLIGMPSGGKTTLGKRAADLMGRPFIDLDERIAAGAGKTIAAIFAEDGEAAFRRMETDAVREAAVETGVVIATGGGCVLKEENVRLLRQNGRLLFLDRPFEQLLFTDDRPLADSADKLRTLYQTRLPIYTSAADAVIHSDGNIKAATQTLINTFREVNR